MNKSLQLLILLIIPMGAAAGSYFAWKRTSATSIQPDLAQQEYAQWVKTLGAKEDDVRDELNELITTTKIHLDPLDRLYVDRLSFTCTDVNQLLEIAEIRTIISKANDGKNDPYALVTSNQRKLLEQLVGPTPDVPTVLKTRRELAKVASIFEVLRQKPDWRVDNVGGEKVEMPMLDMLREGYEFLPNSPHPTFRPNPVIPVFSPADGEFLMQLDTYFNGPRAKAAFPLSKHHQAYLNGRLPAIPTKLALSAKETQKAIDEEKKMILPKEPSADAIEAVNDVFEKLEALLKVVGEFGT